MTFRLLHGQVNNPPESLTLVAMHAACRQEQQEQLLKVLDEAAASVSQVRLPCRRIIASLCRSPPGFLHV